MEVWIFQFHFHLHNLHGLSPSPILAHSHLLHKVAFISLSSVKTLLVAVDVLLISMYLQCKRKNYLEESLKINLISPLLNGHYI